MLPKGPYDPNTNEENILKYWQEKGFFKPEYDPVEKRVKSTEEMKSDKRESFCLINPPPNAYGRPHIGNVSGYAYQDVFSRFARMNGKKVLMLPGKDHAAQEGEAVFIKTKLLPNGKSKKDYTREEFFAECYKYNEENMAQALKDEQRVGLSADFDRNIFTLDPKIVPTVLDTFIQMYKDEMVYKGVRIINWSPGMQSAISDNDTARIERETDFTYINYPLIDTEIVDGKIVKISGKRAWELSFYDANSIQNIIAGRKTVETRALNPEEKEIDRYFGDIKEGDLIICVNKNTGEKIVKEVKRVTTYTNLDELSKKEGIARIFPDDIKTPNDGVIHKTNLEWIDQKFKELYNEKLGEKYVEKINQNGIVAIELANYLPAQAGMLLTTNYISVATTRPETMLGDTAVIVDPTDERYMDIVGKYALLPLVDRIIPIIANGKVEKEFGTGAVKMTPAHSQDDYYMMMDWNVLKEELNREPNKDGQILTSALGYVDTTPVYEAGCTLAQGTEKRISYPKWKEIRETVGEIGYINIIWKDSRMCGPVGKYAGITVEEAREEVIKDLNALNLITKTEKITQNLTICDRTKSVVEPIMSSQWFINVEGKNFKQNAVDAIRRGKNTSPQSSPKLGEEDKEGYVNIHPSNMADKALYWLDNLRDWPISRSIWWGYRIPVWYKGEVKEQVSAEGKVVQTIGGTEVKDMQDALEKELIKIQIENPGEEWQQDPDCLDTWFSSGQWPFATLKAYNLEDTFYPTSVMETGYDILEVWVCRMIMFGMYRMGKVPFKDVYLHGLIKAEDGQKMSKSKGNVVSTDDIIGKYGADTLRLFYINGNKAGASYRVDWEKIEGYRRLLNKIWNASKFVLMNLESINNDQLPIINLANSDEVEKFAANIKEEANQNILKHIVELYKNTTRLMNDFYPGIALQEVTNEFWHTFCDIHIESVKNFLYTQKNKETGEIISEPKPEQKAETQQVLYIALRTYMKMMHPFVPFITETIWQSMPKQEGESETLMYVEW